MTTNVTSSPEGCRSRVSRVLVLTNAYPDAKRPYWGPFVHTTVEGLREAGLTVDVLAVRGYEGKGEYVKCLGRTLRLNAGAPYDVVHASYGTMGVIGRLQLRAPVVIAYTGSDLFGKPRPSGDVPIAARFEAGVYRQMARFVAATITKSENMAAVLPNACRARNHVIPSPTDLRRFGQLTREQARARLGWPINEPVVMFAAHPKRAVKNFPLAEAAVRRVQQEMPEVRLRPTIAVPPAEMPDWLAAADVLLLTSRTEGSPNVVREAMASALPVVSTPVGDVAERIAGLPGCTLAGHDADSLAAGLARALAHGRTPEGRTAVEPFSVERISRRIIDVYETVAEGGRR